MYWSACHIFLLPETDAGLIQFGAQNRVESWPVISQSEQTIALFICEQKWKMNWSEESIFQLIEQYENS